MAGFIGGNAPKERRTFFDQERVSRVASAASAALTTRVTTVEGKVASTVWAALPGVNGWYNYGGGWQAAQYRKIGDIVYLRGLLAGGAAATVICTLPVGFRPPLGLLFACEASTFAHARVDVGANGDVYYNGGGVGNTYLSLDGISFSVTA